MSRVNLPLLVLLAGAALAALSTWWFKHLQVDAPAQAASGAASERAPDQVLEDIVYTVMDADGKAQYRIESPRMTYYKLGTRAEFTTPGMVYFGARGAPVTLQAERAIVTDNGAQILLEGDVTLERPGDDERGALSLVTRDVTVRTEEKTIATQAAITAHGDYYRIAGTGMHANLTDDTIEILSAARGVYEPGNTVR